MFIWLLIIVCVGLSIFFLLPRRSRSISIEESLPPDADGAARDKPLYVDNNVLFTVYQPKVVVPGRWYKLLAYAHLAERRPEATPDAPDPIQEVEREATQILGRQIADQIKSAVPSNFPIPREGELVFAPNVEGISFNPPAQGFMWMRDVHGVEFEMTAAQDYDGQQLKGSLTIFLGRLILADIPLIIKVDSKHPPNEPASFEPLSVRPYRKIFPSYSSRDSKIVEEFERFAEAMGDRYLRDVRTLRSGEEWDRRLRELIEEAEVFQLFWSSNSMRSQFVRQEWEHALTLNRPNFIRPTFWEEPMPRDDELPPGELLSLHFHRLPLPEGKRPRKRMSSSTLMKAIPILLISSVLLAIVGRIDFFQSTENKIVNANMAAPRTPTGTVTLSAQDEQLRQMVLMHLKMFLMDNRDMEGRGSIVVDQELRRVKLFDSAMNVRGIITVTVANKTVTLAGFVADDLQKQAVKACVQQVAGVEKIDDQLSVRN